MSQALEPTQSISLRASAGTGKTWTLTARIVRLLLAGASPGGVLALTFTRKAAAEMRTRVAARLQALAFADDAALGIQLREIGADDDAETRARARGLFELFIYADTPLRASTLHVFCAEVLSRFALEAAVPAGFTLLENERELRGGAIETVLQQAHRNAQGPLAMALDTLASEGLSEFEVRRLLLGVFDHRTELWAASAGHEAPLAALCDALATALPYEADENPYAAIDTPRLSAALTTLMAMLTAGKDVGTVKAANLAPAVECHGAARLHILNTALLNKKGERRAFKPSNRYSAAEAETISACFHTVCAATLEAIEACQRRATYRRSHAALTLGLAALDAFAIALQRRHQLGFAELEWQTVRLLRSQGSAEWVRYKLDQKLEHVLLDEFQDTSPTQWRLLLPLLEELAQRPGRDRTVFLVGDAKQSIYGFRRAEPALLGLAAEWLGQHLGAQTESLDQSRRSAPAIIHFANALFANEAGAAIDYSPHQTALTALHGRVEVAPLIVAEASAAPSASNGLRNPLTTPLEVAEDRRASEEAHWVVDRITQIIEQGMPVTSRDGHNRAMHFGDVMVLARHRTHLGVLEKALGAAGIPYSSATRGTLLDTAIAQDLLALLAVLDSPHRNLDLAHSLRSPLFSASDDDLLWLAEAATRSTQSWYAVLCHQTVPPGLQRAQQWLPHWRQLSQQLPPHDLIDRLTKEGDLLRRCRAARPQDTQLGANLAALLQLALDSDHGRYPTLGGFLRQCQALAEGDGPDEAPPPSSEARVRVMTVHAAKGLEAPAVFLVNAAPSARPPQPGWRVHWPADAERPQVIVHAGKSEQREKLSQQLLEQEQQREAREALNLLYVAVTRAQQYLFVSGFQSGKSFQPDSWHARCRKALQELQPEAVDEQQLWQFSDGAMPTIVAAAPTRQTATIIDPRLQQPLASMPTPAPRDTAAQDTAAVLRGQAIHAALQGLSSQPSRSEAALLAQVQQQLGLQLPAALWQSVLSEAQAVFTAPTLAPFFAPAHKAWNEVPLHISTAESVQVNVLDRLVDTGTALWVLDYKTHRHGEPAHIMAQAEAQLRRYLAAVQRLFPQRSVKAAVIWTPEALLLPLP